jgi:hypothetical protein
MQGLFTPCVIMEYTFPWGYMYILYSIRYIISNSLTKNLVIIITKNVIQITVLINLDFFFARLIQFYFSGRYNISQSCFMTIITGLGKEMLRGTQHWFVSPVNRSVFRGVITNTCDFAASDCIVFITLLLHTLVHVV